MKRWYKTFPEVTITIGNHDRRPDRKAFNAGISKKWLKTIDEVIEAPEGWKFYEDFILDRVLYCHGEGKVAHKRMDHEMMSSVQGHIHTNSSIRFKDGKELHQFSMQLGCGFDASTFAGAYAKGLTSQAINCGVVLENGKLPIIERM